jgi:hypothetical protein
MGCVSGLSSEAAKSRNLNEETTKTGVASQKWLSIKRPLSQPQN